MNQEDPQIQNRPITNDQKSTSRVASPLDNMGAIRVYALAPHLRSRITSIYMVSSFVGAATGSAFGALVWAQWHWTGVCLLGVAISVLAFGILLSWPEKFMR